MTSPEGRDWYENQQFITEDVIFGPDIGWLYTDCEQKLTVGCADCPWSSAVDNAEEAIVVLMEHRRPLTIAELQAQWKHLSPGDQGPRST